MQTDLHCETVTCRENENTTVHHIIYLSKLLSSHCLYGLYGPQCPLSAKRPLNLIAPTPTRTPSTRPHPHPTHPPPPAPTPPTPTRTHTTHPRPHYLVNRAHHQASILNLMWLVLWTVRLNVFPARMAKNVGRGFMVIYQHVMCMSDIQYSKPFILTWDSLLQPQIYLDTTLQYTQYIPRNKFLE